MATVERDAATARDVKGPDDFRRGQRPTITIRSEDAQEGAVQRQRRGVAVTVDHRVRRRRGFPVADFETAARMHDEAVGVLGRIGAG